MKIDEVLRAAVRVKWAEQVKQMEYADLCLDMYEFEQDDTTNKAIFDMFPLTAQDVIKFKEDYPLTSDIVNKCSLLFREPAGITLDFGKTEAGESKEEKTITLFNESLVRKPKLPQVMNNIQRMVNLLGKVGIMPRWYERGQVMEYVLITRANCFVIQDIDSPSHAIGVAIKTANLQDTPANVQRVDTFELWTDTERSICTVGNDGLPNILSTLPNPYGFIPVVWFDNSVQSDEFWREGKNPVIDANRAYNWKRALINLQLVYQTYSLLILEGDGAPGTIKVGSNAYINIPSDKLGGNSSSQKAYYISPESKITEVLATCEQYIDRIANSEGLSTEAFRQKTDFPSGYALKLSKQDIIDRNMLEKPIYIQTMIDMLEMTIKCFNYHNKTSQILAEATNIKVDIAEIKVDIDPIDRERTRAMKMANGTASSIDFIMEDNPDLTRDEAIEKYKQIQTETQLYPMNMPVGATDAV